MQSPENLAQVSLYRSFQVTEAIAYMGFQNIVSTAFDSHIPSFRKAFKFCKRVASEGGASFQSGVVCAALIRRMVTQKQIILHTKNWQPLLIAALNISHKSCHGGAALHNINEIWKTLDVPVNDLQANAFEWQCLEKLKFKVSASPEEYSRTIKALKVIENSEPRDSDFEDR